MVALLPVSVPGPAIPPEIGRVLFQLLDSQRTGATLNPQLLAEGATSEFCSTYSSCLPSEQLKSWPLGSEFVHNQPYLLADGRIRVEWVRKGKLEYLSFVRFYGGKVKDITTLPASMPRVQCGR